MDVFMVAVLNLLALLWVARVNGDVFVKDTLTNHTIKKYSDLQASFGIDFPPDGLEGWLVYASPDPMACSSVNPPPVNSTWCADFNCNFILLIARGGNCEFSDKVLAAENSGYAAAIVHNFPGNDSVVEMEACTNGSLVHIPATFVGYSHGMELRNYNYTGWRYIITIMEEDEELRLFLWPFAVVIGVCFLFIMIFMLVKVIREQTSKKLNRLSKRSLKKIPVRKFKKGDYYDTCAICLDEYEEGEKIRVLPCDHVYHMKCIDPWLTKNKKTCPVCKRRVILDRDADSESGSDAENPSGSENTPLLAGQTRGPSHGSVTDSSVVLNSTHPDAPSPSQDARTLMVTGDRALLPDSDIEHGAVGGEDIAISNHSHQTLLTGAKPSRGNIQEADDESDPESERKRKRKDWMGNQEKEEEGISSSLLGAENRVERREKRKQRKDKKKKAESRLRSVGQELENAVPEQANESKRSATPVAGGGQEGGALMRSLEEGAHMSHEEDGHLNPSYSDNNEVVVAAASTRRDWSDVV
ncbi:hypothetical protein BsWGS_09213 [Bradybaena similaris]